MRGAAHIATHQALQLLQLQLIENRFRVIRNEKERIIYLYTILYIIYII